MAQALNLAEPALPWHTQRQQIAEVAGALAVAAGTVAKITYDIALLMQLEVGEASEGGGPNRGGSSTLPQKQNPVSATTVGGAARRATALTAVIHGALAHEHERGVGNWHAEWATLTELLQLSGGAVAGAAECVAGLQVNALVMAENLAASGPSLLAERFTLELTRRAGRSTAVSLVAEALASPTADGVDFLDALVRAGVTTWITPDELTAFSDPSTYLGSSNDFIDHALAAHEQRLAL
jgi:3-carboxy-cis,cis-muconate cycloisomerase